MTQPGIFRKIVSGEAGVWATPVRAGLRLLELGYAAAVARRNKRYDRIGPNHAAAVPVISVGNLTVGGTGKTPTVIDLLLRLKNMGYTPGVVARGYKADGGRPNDEELVIRNHCPGVVYVANPDRVAGADLACRKYGANVIVLDDGFQHRRLARDLDIVLVDATCPFGYDHVLPRGLLREPVRSLARADVIIVTRCDQVSNAQRAEVLRRIKQYSGDSPILTCGFRVRRVEALDGSPIAGSLQGKRVVLLAGIANPMSFRETVRALGAEIVGEKWWPDHHNYRAIDLHGMLVKGAYPPRDWLVMTEKDAVKLAELEGIGQAKLAVVKAAIDFQGDSDTMLQAALDRTLSGFRPAKESGNRSTGSNA